MAEVEASKQAREECSESEHQNGTGVHEPIRKDWCEYRYPLTCWKCQQRLEAVRTVVYVAKEVKE